MSEHTPLLDTELDVIASDLEQPVSDKDFYTEAARLLPDLRESRRLLRALRDGVFDSVQGQKAVDEALAYLAGCDGKGEGT
jgi:hypothetical protein